MTKPRILIVEDEPIIAMELESRLSNFGYDSAGSVASGEEALEKIEQDRPDLVLMDIRLKGKMDGIETADRIRSRQDVPVIFLTAFSDPKTLDRAKDTSPFGFLTKPINERELHANIEMALYKSRMERRLTESEERFRSIFDSANDGIIVADIEKRRILFGNATIGRMLGYSADEIGRLGLDDIYREEDMPIAQKDFEAGANRTPPLSDETPVVRKDGTVFYADISSSEIILQGKRLGVSTFRDVSERKRLSEEREKLVADLRQALAKVKTLSGLLPICYYCKKIRSDQGYWEQLETYIQEHSSATLSHGICDDCMTEHFPQHKGKNNASE